MVYSSSGSIGIDPILGPNMVGRWKLKWRTRLLDTSFFNKIGLSSVNGEVRVDQKKLREV